MKFNQSLNLISNPLSHPLESETYRRECKATLDRDGVLLLQDFLSPEAIASVKNEGQDNIEKAFFTSSKHNAYLSPPDTSFAEDHPRNRLITSSKGCITTDQIPEASLLHTLYENDSFKAYLCAVLGIENLYEYADPLSSINLHYASDSQELGWHFDNSSFAITLLIQKPAEGGVFEYKKDARNAEENDMNYDLVGQVLDQQVPVDTLEINEGDLVLFRGRNSIHRVSPTIGDTTRMLVVLAYNTEPGISLSESARQTFYGRLN